MPRINLTLDSDTFRNIDRHARRAGKPRARLVKDILTEGLARRDALERRRRLAADYAKGRDDAREVLKDLERWQLELVDDEDA
jgi:metal-responsive CopG/Arc/MetJ family transcriptional regulator